MSAPVRQVSGIGVLPSLRDSELERYSRHIVIPEIGGAGQQKLKASRVAIVGLGGLGCPVALYLAAAGIGTLILIDDDVVDLSNLQRQVLYATAHVGKPKCEVAAAVLRALNPEVDAKPRCVRMTSASAKSELRRADVVVDASDSYATRQIVASVCHQLKRPLVSAGIGRFDGYVTTIAPWMQIAAGTHGPTFEAMFPAAPREADAQDCLRAGILGGAVGVLGSIQAVETVKLLVGFGRSLVGRLLLLDMLNWRISVIACPPTPADEL